MNRVQHPNNCPWWTAKEGAAGEADVAGFALAYQREHPGAWCVAVSEGRGWLAAHDLKLAVALTRDRLNSAVWLSDGKRAQAIWRHP